MNERMTEKVIAPCGVEVKVGQIWQEVDPRHFVDRRVVSIDVIGGGTTGYVYTVGVDTGVKTRCNIKRFHGKRGGYRLVKDAQ